MTWKFDSSSPIYIQIADRVLTEILGGRYAEGERIPSVRELAAVAGVNPNTVQHAMLELERLGAVSTLTGDGRYVTDDQAVLGALRTEAAEKAAKIYAQKILTLAIPHETAKEMLNKAFNDLMQAGTKTGGT